MAPRPKPNLRTICRWAAQDSLLFNEDGTPFSATVHAGAPKLAVLAGDNASGKSLLFRIIAAKVAEAGATPVTVSIRERTGGGMRQTFMFGDEDTQSTGAVSISTVTRAFANLDRPAGTILGLDEPELGLSDGYTYALGRYIGEQALQLPRPCGGVVVVTHSRELVRGLVDGHGRKPTFISAGADATLDTWLTSREEHTVDELLSLDEIGHERFLWAQATLRSSSRRA